MLYICRHVCVPVFEQRPEHHDGCPLLLLSVLFPQDRVSYSIWNSLVFVSLIDQYVPEIHPPSSPHWGYRCAWPHVGAGALNPGPPAVQKVLWATEPSPWPTAFISKNWLLNRATTLVTLGKQSLHFSPEGLPATRQSTQISYHSPSLPHMARWTHLLWIIPNNVKHWGV